VDISELSPAAPAGRSDSNDSMIMMVTVRHRSLSDSEIVHETDSEPRLATVTVHNHPSRSGRCQPEGIMLPGPGLTVRVGSCR
jgi:hypothetical protein